MPTTYTHTVTLYKYHELSENAQERARDAYRDISTEYYGWWDSVYEWQREELEAQGFPDAAINFQLSYSQSDGARFTCRRPDLAQWMRTQKLARKYRALYNAATTGAVHANVDRVSMRDVHEGSARAEIEIRDYPDTVAACKRLEEQVAAVEQMLEEWRYRRCQEIYRALESEHEYLTSDDHVAEMIAANEYEFSEEGTPEHRIKFHR